MSKMSEFIAFRAAMELLKDENKQHIIDEVYRKCIAQKDKRPEEIVNYVKDIFDQFSEQQVADKIAEMLTPEGTKSEVKIVFQTIEGLHEACPNHKGDWYFSGNYPTPGGNKVVNDAFINYIEGEENKTYQFKLTFKHTND